MYHVRLCICCASEHQLWSVFNRSVYAIGFSLDAQERLSEKLTGMGVWRGGAGPGGGGVDAWLADEIVHLCLVDLIFVSIDFVNRSRRRDVFCQIQAQTIALGLADGNQHHLHHVHSAA